MKSVREILLSDFGIDITDQHLTGMRVELMRKFREELKPIPGIGQVLARLGLPCCVASSGTLDRIRYALDVTGLLELLEPHLFSAAMVARGKPAPDLFLHAAAKMGAIPQN
ncbi:MAG: hydrolase, partial [Mesorhizobium sp.]